MDNPTIGTKTREQLWEENYFTDYQKRADAIIIDVLPELERRFKERLFEQIGKYEQSHGFITQLKLEYTSEVVVAYKKLADSISTDVTNENLENIELRFHICAGGYTDYVDRGFKRSLNERQFEYHVAGIALDLIEMFAHLVTSQYRQKEARSSLLATRPVKTAE